MRKVRSVLQFLVDKWVDFAMSESFIFYVGGLLIAFTVTYILIAGQAHEMNW